MKKLVYIILLLMLPTVIFAKQTTLPVSDEALKDYGFLSPIREAKDCTRKNPLKMMETVHFTFEEVDVYMKIHRYHFGEKADRIMKDSLFYTSSPYLFPYIVDFRVMTVDNNTDTEISISEYDFEVYSLQWKKEEKTFVFEIPYRQDNYQGYPGSFGRFSFAGTTTKDETIYLKYMPTYNSDFVIWFDPANQYYFN